MRNIFDQYEQPENRLTHALFTVLHREKQTLLVPFLKWVGIPTVPRANNLTILVQQVPGTTAIDSDDSSKMSLPDACIHDENSWIALFECKVQASLNHEQILQHKKTAISHDFSDPHIVTITVAPMKDKLPTSAFALTWSDIYRWLSRSASKSQWARELIDYMQTFERKMLSQDYGIQGAITVFDGLKFDKQNPYTYREAKRLLRLLGDELQQRKDLIEIGIDPHGKRRPAITGSNNDPVWDFIPLRIARNAKQFTQYPHFTMYLSQERATAAVTIPNGVKTSVRRRITDLGLIGFMVLLRKLERRLRPVLKKSPEAKPLVYVTQRHFRTQRSRAVVDARLEADLRTAVPCTQSKVKYQPQWAEGVYTVLTNKKCNLQLGIELNFSYNCKLLQSEKAVGLFARTWKALHPIVTLFVDE